MKKAPRITVFTSLTLLLCFLAGLMAYTAPPMPAQAATNVTIYGDQLANGWSNWSWGTTVNLSNSTPVHGGNRSISARYTQAWAGFYLHANTAVSTSGYTGIRFWIHGGSAGNQKVVFAANQNNSKGAQLTLKANAWTQVNVSLASLGNPASISDLWWQDAAGKAQPIFYIDDIILVAGSGTPPPTASPTARPPSVTPTPSGSKYFTTLPPGSRLPSDAECAAAIKSRPENKRMNTTYNNTRGNQGLASDFFGSAVDPRANTQLASRVTGNFTGTTDEILQWAACKWGVDEDMVRAQAAIESWWHQDTKGDWGTNASNCPPGHGLGVDGRPGECPESWGILQNRYPYVKSSWPGIANSTAFNTDTGYAIWRACYEGYEWWLNDVDRGSQYTAGDAWGCIGRWFAGRWHTQAAEDYIGRVSDYLNQRIWETSNFQEP